MKSEMIRDAFAFIRGGLVVLVGVSLLQCGTNGQGSQSEDTLCSLIGDKKCGKNSLGQHVVLECKPLSSGGTSQGGTTKEWQVSEVCDHCCILGVCEKKSTCERELPEDVTAYDDIKPTKKDVGPPKPCNNAHASCGNKECGNMIVGDESAYYESYSDVCLGSCGSCEAGVTCKHGACGQRFECGGSLCTSINEALVAADLETGLAWQRFIPELPQGCGADSLCTFEEGESYCESLSLGGYEDWRVPDIRELLSVAEYDHGKLLNLAAVDEHVFPSTPKQRFWTSTPSKCWDWVQVNESENSCTVETDEGIYETDECDSSDIYEDEQEWECQNWAGRYYALRFFSLSQDYLDHDEEARVRCVRGESTKLPPVAFDNENSHFSIHEEYVEDTMTGLTWQRELPGGNSNCSGSEYCDWLQASAYCSWLAQQGYAGFDDWRLPTVLELMGLAEFSNYSGRGLDASVFPDTPECWFWSADITKLNYSIDDFHELGGSDVRIWAVDGWSGVGAKYFGFGASYSSEFAVRCVR